MENSIKIKLARNILNGNSIDKKKLILMDHSDIYDIVSCAFRLMKEEWEANNNFTYSSLILNRVINEFNHLNDREAMSILKKDLIFIINNNIDDHPYVVSLTKRLLKNA